MADEELNKIPQSGRHDRKPDPDDQIVLLSFVGDFLQNGKKSAFGDLITAAPHLNHLHRGDDKKRSHQHEE